VPEGVAEVEQGPLAAFVFVRDDHFGLVPARTAMASASTSGRGTAGTPGWPQAIRETAGPDQTVFDDFGQARPQFTIGQRIQGIGIGQHQFRLMEGPDHVLAERMIDRCLAAHRRINLRQQSRRDLDEGHAALKTGRRKPVMSPTTPPPRASRVVDRSQRRCSRAVENRIQRLPVLELFAIGQDDLDDFDSSPPQRP
jgi:hypothetical protein